VPHLAAYTLNLLLDTDRAAVGVAAIGPCEIDVLPAEPEDFTTAQPIENEEDERGVKWIRLGNGKELSRLDHDAPTSSGDCRSVERPGPVAVAAPVEGAVAVAALPPPGLLGWSLRLHLTHFAARRALKVTE
jgi:hypothetical protein